MIKGLIVLVAVCVGVIPTGIASAEGKAMPELEQSYLQKAAEGHQSEVALGRLAIQKASSDRVKQYAARMIQDHQRIGEEVHKLTSQEGTPVPSQPSMPHQQMEQKLSQLSGKDFDRPYMAFMVRDHTKELGDWEKRGQTLTDPRMEHWQADTLAILKDHLAEAKAIAAAIGVSAK